MECRESRQKNGTRGGGRLQEKEKSTTQTTMKWKTSKESVSQLSQGRKRILRRPLRGRTKKTRWCRQRYTKKRTREESSALKDRIEVNQADHENWRRQIAQSVKENAKESYSFLRDEQRSEKQNALLIFTALEKWFYFCRTTNLAFYDLTIGKVAQKHYSRFWELG